MHLPGESTNMDNTLILVVKLFRLEAYIESFMCVCLRIWVLSLLFFSVTFSVFISFQWHDGRGEWRP